MGIHHVLITSLQLLLTSGVGAALIVGWSTKGLFLKDETPAPEEHRFANDYQELMWLAERQKRHLDTEETRRFYQLRRSWAGMHSQIVGR
jgi:hypothetical protein